MVIILKQRAANIQQYIDLTSLAFHGLLWLCCTNPSLKLMSPSQLQLRIDYINTYTYPLISFLRLLFQQTIREQSLSSVCLIPNPLSSFPHYYSTPETKTNPVPPAQPHPIQTTTQSNPTQFATTQPTTPSPPALFLSLKSQKDVLLGPRLAREPHWPRLSCRVDHLLDRQARGRRRRYRADEVH